MTTIKPPKTNFKYMTAAAVMAVVGQLTGIEAKGVQVDHLGVNNTLVRVTDPGKYLLMPVQDGNDEAKVDVVVDGKIAETFNISLAKAKVDYKVPFHLDKYKGHNIVLNIVTRQDRSTVREAKGDAAWTNFEVVDEFDTTNREKYRPMFHHTPLYGWMNDPNGMVYKDGVWHLAYQWNPYGSRWQNMTWGQSTSKDLINWDRTIDPILEPDGLGMIFSGSSAVDKTGSAGFGKDAIVTMFTSAATSQIQSLASSTDGGYTYTTYPGNPVLPLESEARDPNMFWDEEAGHWVMTLAHALDKEMLIFTSPDLKEWTLQSAFGKGLGAQDGVWECPDLFELALPGTDKTKWVLICNINPGGPFGGSATQYFVGDFDGKTFTADTDKDGNVVTKWMDYGKDHYATVSFSDAPDNRRTVIGWMSNWQYAAEVPTLQFRSANTLPRDLSLFEGPDGQIYLASAPSPEVAGLRGKLEKSVSSINAKAKGTTVALPTANNGICEILADIDAQKASTVSLTLANPAGEKCVITYNAADRTVTFDRTAAGISDFSQDFPSVTVSPSFETNGRVSLRIFVDTSSIELFGNDGRIVMTNLVFPENPYTTLTVSATGGTAKVSNLKIYSINPTK